MVALFGIMRSSGSLFPVEWVEPLSPRALPKMLKDLAFCSVPQVRVSSLALSTSCLFSLTQLDSLKPAVSSSGVPAELRSPTGTSALS